MNNTTTNAARTADTESNCTGAEGILCPWLERNLPDTPACFKNTLTKASWRCQSLIFLVFFPLDNLKSVVIPKTNKQFKEPTDIYEFLRFIWCWFYMACWEVIPSRHSWWSSKTTDMFHGYPFQLKKYISSNIFDDIIGALRYTNEEVQCTAKFLYWINNIALWVGDGRTLSWNVGLIPPKKEIEEKMYQKQSCINNYVCGKRVITYCKCNQGLFLCTEFFDNNKFSKTMETWTST